MIARREFLKLLAAIPVVGALVKLPRESPLEGDIVGNPRFDPVNFGTVSTNAVFTGELGEYRNIRFIDQEADWFAKRMDAAMADQLKGWRP